MIGQFGCHIRVQQCQTYENRPEFSEETFLGEGGRVVSIEEKFLKKKL
jgi:hypothetical protein